MPEIQSVDQIMALLHIDVIGQIEAAHDMIRQSVQIEPTVASYPEFQETVGDYVRYHNAMWHGVDPGQDRAWGQARAAIDEQMRPEPTLARIRGFLDAQGSYVQAIKNGLTGRHGGMIGVIDTIAEQIKKEAVSQWVRSVFLTHINPLDFDRKVEFAREYLATYGALLLPNETTMSPYELAAQIEVLLETHVRLVNQLRDRLQ